MDQHEVSGAGRGLSTPLVLLVSLLSSVPVLAQPSVEATAFLENADAVGVAEAVVLWRNLEDPDASRILVAEGAGGVVHYALDGTDPQALTPAQNVSGLAITHHGGGLAEGQAMVATVSRDTAELLFHLLRFNDEGVPESVSQHAMTRGGDAALGYESANSLAFSVGPDGRLFLFVAFPNEIEQLELELGEEGPERLASTSRPLLGAEKLLTSDASGSFVYAAAEEGGISEVSSDPDAPDGFLQVFSPLDVGFLNGLAMDTRTATAGTPAYLLTSNGITNTLRIFEPLADPPRFVQSFQVLSGNGQIPAPVAGLALTTEPVGTLFPEGLLVVTTGTIGSRRGALVSWGDVARSFDPPLFFVEEGSGGEPDGGTGGDGGEDGGTDGGTNNPNNPVPGGPDIALPQLPREDVGCGCTGAGSLSTVSLLLGSGLFLLRRRRR